MDNPWLTDADIKSTQIYAHLASEADGQVTRALDAVQTSTQGRQADALEKVSREDLIAALQVLIGTKS